MFNPMGRNELKDRNGVAFKAGQSVRFVGSGVTGSPIETGDVGVIVDVIDNMFPIICDFPKDANVPCVVAEVEVVR